MPTSMALVLDRDVLVKGTGSVEHNLQESRHCIKKDRRCWLIIKLPLCFSLKQWNNDIAKLFFSGLQRLVLLSADF